MSWTRPCTHAAGLAIALSGSIAFAQGQGRPPITVKQAPPAQRPIQREVQKVPEAAPAAPAAEEAQSTRASDLLGTDLVLENGDTLGKVNDLIIDNRNGQVAYVIVETDQDYRPIPWKALALYQGEQAGDQYFIIGMERDRFMEAPAIQRTEWQTYRGPQWQTQWHTFQPRVGQFYADVRVAAPRNVRGDVRRDLNQVDRKLEQGERKLERKAEQTERKIERKID